MCIAPWFLLQSIPFLHYIPILYLQQIRLHLQIHNFPDFSVSELFICSGLGAQPLANNRF